MSNKLLFVFLVSVCISTVIHSQMIADGDTLYGNEWINYDQSYFKVKVAEDGIYRLSGATLLQAGVPVGSIQAGQYQLYWMGKEQPLYLSTQNTMGPEDYIEFYGRKNRSELDRFLFEQPDEEMLNPEKSFYGEVATYFLTWSNQEDGIRFENLITDVNGEIPPVQSWYWHKELISQTTDWVKALDYGDGVSDSDFNAGEGFGSPIRQSNSIQVPVSDLFTEGPPAQLMYRLTGNYTRSSHRTVVRFNDEEIKTLIHARNELVRDTFSISLADLREINSVSYIGQDPAEGEVKDRNSIGLITLKYPRLFRTSTVSLNFSIPTHDEALLLQLPSDNPVEQPVLYNLTSPNRIEGVFENGMVSFILPPSDSEFEYQFSADELSSSIIEIQKKEFELFDQSDANFLIITNRQLLKGGKIDDYVQYRSSPEGGNHQVDLLFIDDLGDLFAYGLWQHPFSIKNFSNYVKGKWENLEFILLMGKSLQYDELNLNPNQKEEDRYFLPSYGIPASDNLLISDGLSPVPNFSIGRLAVYHPDQIEIYLNKLQEFEEAVNNPSEVLEERLWLKRGLHLAGGKTIVERNQLFRNLESMRDIIENGSFGAKIYSHLNFTDDLPTEVLNVEHAQDLMNVDGVILKTYFGHGATETTQLDNFENTFFMKNHRYPISTAMGCYTGNSFIHKSNSLGETNLFTPNKGSISYIATTGAGYIQRLLRYGKIWYNLMSNQLYGKSVGLSFQRTIDSLYQGSSNELLQQLSFQGDPAIKVASTTTPDYTFDYNNSYVETANLDVDSFNVKFRIVNLGKFVPGQDLVIRIFLNSLEQNFGPYDFSIKDPGFEQDISIALPTKLLSSGLFTLRATIDPDNLIQELPTPLAEENNVLKSNANIGIPFSVISGGVRPIWPYDFAIVNDSPFVVQSSTLNALAPHQAYLIEMDTSELFNSPIKVGEEIAQSGGVIRWESPIPPTEGKTYYWRISEKENISWITQSFSYLPNENLGWRQQHYYQFLKNRFHRLDVRNSPDNLEFELQKRVIEFNLGPQALERSWIIVDGSNWGNLNPINLGSFVGVFAMHENRYEPAIQDRNMRFGSINTRPYTYGYHMDKNEDYEGLLELLQTFPERSRVFIYGMLVDDTSSFHFEKWDERIFDFIEGQGAVSVRSLKDLATIPFVIIYDVNEGLVLEKYGDSRNEPFNAVSSFKVYYNEGQMHSVKIGPVQTWKSLKWKGRIENSDQSLATTIHASDSTLHSLKGVEDSLFMLMANSRAVDTIGLTLNAVDADVNRDEAPDLDFWQVNYTPLADLAIDPSSQFTFSPNDKLVEEGDTIVFEVMLRNVSQTDFDSCHGLINVLGDFPNSDDLSIEFTIPSIQAGDSLLLVKQITSDGLFGPQTFQFIANHDRSVTELHYFNNLLTTRFDIDRDMVPPILEVLFDGRIIRNYDYVSPNPEIHVRLHDNNPNLLIDDTSYIELYLYPENELPKRISYQEDWVTFIPSASAQEGANVILLPELSPGRYVFAANAKDVSGNQAGRKDYTILFEVTDTEVFHIEARPNPASVRLGFYYTSSKQRSDFTLDIYSTDGRLIIQEVINEIILPAKESLLYSLDTSNLSPGVYYYVLRTANDSIDGRFMVANSN